MAVFVSAAWVQERTDSKDIILLDPRQLTRYLQGHIKNAVNLPAARAFDSAGKLLGEDALERWLATAGLGSEKSPVIYDAYDGRNGAMLVWLLEYLGRTDVHLMDVFFERWVAEGREVFYRPVEPKANEFKARVNPTVRSSQQDILTTPGLKLIDFRSRDEYTGKQDTEGKPGHIPMAINVVWQDLIGEDHRFLAAKERLQQLFSAAGISSTDKVVAYCRTGPRAALGYIALQELGYDAHLYVGSYAEWARSGLPVELS